MHFDPRESPFSVDGRPASDRDELGRRVLEPLIEFLEQKKKTCDALAEEHALVGYPHFRDLERDILLRVLDTQWKDHLHTMDGLREGINLRGYASRDPKLEYQREGYALFEEMNERIDGQVLETVFKFALPEPVQLTPRPVARSPLGVQGRGLGAEKSGSSKKQRAGKPGRNDPCVCGSGKKYKKCCGAS